MNTVKILLSLAAMFDWNLQQFDVKNAFLHGDLEEEVFMEPPSRFDEDFGADKICHLKKLCTAKNNLLEHGLGDLQRQC